ncbi:MAG: ISL3 family transposase [Planctomycetaceae bacterium]
MSTSALYRAIGMKGYEHVSATQSAERFTLRMRAPADCVKCPGCQSKSVIRRGTVDRLLHAPPIGLRPTVLFVSTPRVECRQCGTVRTVVLPGVSSGKNHTQSFARMVIDLRKLMTITDVALYLGVSTHMVRDIDKAWLAQHFAKPRLRDVKAIAIDEISVGKGRKFLTIVMDLESGAIVFVGQGKGQAALTSFWNRLRGSKARICAVATDMSSAYYAAVQKNLPKATLVFDRFHIVKLMNEKLTTLRRELHREAEDQLQKSTLKGTRWLLLKHPDHLEPERNDQERLQKALEMNHSLAVAYYLKEDLRQIWEQPARHEAARFLKDWCARARASGIRVLRTMANTLEGHRTGILNWYRFRISTGPLEGLNNKIKTMKRQAYGFRDTEYFTLKLYALHLTKFALIG